MAQNFRNYLTRNTGTSAVDALGGAANSYDTLISVRMANVTTSTIAVDVYLKKIISKLLFNQKCADCQWRLTRAY